MSTRMDAAVGSAIVLITFFIIGAGSTHAQVVPGTGSLLNMDDFEDPNWAFTFNFPKSSKEEDEQIRFPLGRASNGRWFESPKRGTPDVVKRVATPAGGLEGSTGALYLRSRDTGIPGRPSYSQKQDDFILQAKPLSISSSPNFVVRVYLPPWDQWEQRTGVSFGMRAGVQGPHTTTKQVSFGKFFFKGSRTETVTEMEPIYPGMFIQYNCPKDRNYKEDHAVIIIRAGNDGQDIVGPKIEQTGWWTFGQSHTPDSRVHYYARPGVSDLTAADLIVSTTPHSREARYFNTIFFNICSTDNGTTWSTPWIIDDPKVYHLGGNSSQMAGGRQQMRR
ncbi:MAG: hypothetical protein KDA93_14735 [Planctomycetaceae bacterium]|nr:hypothetical protein [Planctomycetaceae bacterium]